VPGTTAQAYHHADHHNAPEIIQATEDELRQRCNLCQHEVDLLLPQRYPRCLQPPRGVIEGTTMDGQQLKELELLGEGEIFRLRDACCR
jgi:hypothetical protein